MSVRGGELRFRVEITPNERRMRAFRVALQREDLFTTDGIVYWLERLDIARFPIGQYLPHTRRIENIDCNLNV